MLDDPRRFLEVHGGSEESRGDRVLVRASSIRNERATVSGSFADASCHSVAFAEGRDGSDWSAREGALCAINGPSRQNSGPACLTLMRELCDDLVGHGAVAGTARKMTIWSEDFVTVFVNVGLFAVNCVCDPI